MTLSCTFIKSFFPRNGLLCQYFIWNCYIYFILLWRIILNTPTLKHRHSISFFKANFRLRFPKFIPKAATEDLVFRAGQIRLWNVLKSKGRDSMKVPPWSANSVLVSIRWLKENNTLKICVEIYTYKNSLHWTHLYSVEVWILYMELHQQKLCWQLLLERFRTFWTLINVADICILKNLKSGDHWHNLAKYAHWSILEIDHKDWLNFSCGHYHSQNNIQNCSPCLLVAESREENPDIALSIMLPSPPKKLANCLSAKWNAEMLMWEK